MNTSTCGIGKMPERINRFPTPLVPVDAKGEPRPTGRIYLTRNTIWITRYKRAPYPVSNVNTGEWMPYSHQYTATASRRALVKAYQARQFNAAKSVAARTRTPRVALIAVGV